MRRALRELAVANPLTVVGNGEEALAELRNNETRRPALIFLDLNMPRMSGLEFLRQVRSDGCAEGIPIVVLTTSRQDEDVQEGFHHNIAGYMVKPVEYGRFVEVMTAIQKYWNFSELPA